MRAARSWATFLGLLACCQAAKQPNIIVILTDDQDWEMKSLDYMPLLRKHVIDQGTLYDRHYCTVSICCPSRVNLWTGRAAHNTNVTDVDPPYGGYPKFVYEGLNDNWLPVWLQDLGYNTYYTGKLFNSLDVDNYNNPPVKGFNGSEFLLDPYTYRYFGSVMSRNGAAPVSYKGQYSPDVVAEKTYGFLDEAAQSTKPFFLTAAPVAPHFELTNSPKDGVRLNPPQYAQRHAHLFQDYKIPRTPDFNPDIPSGVSWIKGMPKLNDTVIEYYDEFQRARLRSLQAVDEMVEQLVQRLDAKGLLDNTYIFYTTDNGFHIGQHRMHPGKECAFESDVHIPLAVRGPGVPAGNTAGVVSSHTDLTPTILKLAGANRADLDGSPIPLLEHELAQPESGEHVNVEFWGSALGEGNVRRVCEADALSVVSLGPMRGNNNTYKALRLIGEGYNLLYTVWCTGEKEFYDLTLDPYQMQNYLDANSAELAENYEIADCSFAQLISRLDALLMVLKSCKAKSCQKPWSTLHPAGEVTSLKDALHPKFDGFYEQQSKVSFSSCAMGYIISEEGPQEVNVWNDGAHADLV
ncbi:uncharacterized protein MYCGRDRAFT_40096 [Zymoseptoria tritici IPO323]|uniref:Arylsulfatase n=1 Tax=Zymoseptoria tritici (strain CBS 115943 / IPO323) TaxID=336722 RepID=F9X9U1_ZYMTI|nr:uncharacterized protein MYCGRDRAFT_40096 [Zymoseptoria tritici IPO323]EGP88164.1 hypothetical protein MYCGRDRAFT_40096 [Zymoseptoria tritici IPO323]